MLIFKLFLKVTLLILLDRNQLKDQLLMTPEESGASTTILLEALVLLLDPKLPWACKTVGYLMQRNVFSLFREVILTVKVHFFETLFLVFF